VDDDRSVESFDSDEPAAALSEDDRLGLAAMTSFTRIDAAAARARAARNISVGHVLRPQNVRFRIMTNVVDRMRRIFGCIQWSP
jgi:hypothetical protein